MPSAPTDRERDLLYGIIALQLRFVTKDQVIEVLTLLLQTPEKTARDLFLEKGFLGEKQSEALLSVMDAELERHGGHTAQIVGSLHDSPTVAQSIADLRSADSPLPSSLEATLGWDRYEVMEELGRGGVGKVLLALDESLMGREVAMKLLLPLGGERDADVSPRDRFLEEARVTALLQHPNIVPIYEMGTSPGGELYYTMPVVRGQTFKDEIRRAHTLRRAGEVSLDEWALGRMRLLSAFQGICHAISYAHSRGVVHRDIKPHNVMLGDFGEAIVLDWGLAKIIDLEATPSAEGNRASDSQSDRDLRERLQKLKDRSASQTLEGSIAGTPAYMPPEQAEGRIGEVDTRSDIYSLGAVLYEILTGVPPVEGETAYETLFKVIAGNFPGPRERGIEVDAEIAAICEKAMSLEKRDRYPTVASFSREIALYLEGARERRRRREEAARLAKAGNLSAREHREHHAEEQRLRMEARSMERSIKGSDPIEAKKPLWELQERAQAASRAVHSAMASAERSFHGALELDAVNADARLGLATLYLDELLKAEAVGDADRVHYYAELVENYHDGHYARELSGDGTLSLRTTPDGAEVHLFRFETWERRLIPVPVRAEPGWAPPEGKGIPTSAGWYLQLDDASRLGTAPLLDVPIPMGSYLLILRADGYRDVRRPLLMGRNREATVGVRLYRDEEIGQGFVYVPGGPFTAGGDSEVQSSWERRVIDVPDFFIARHPLTGSEYQEFLNDVARSDPDEARSHAPRRADGRVIWTESETHEWTIPTDVPDVPQGPDLPVVLVTWDDAHRYLEWRSKRDGRTYRLPTEAEREKAARGVDARPFPWGNHFDATWCAMQDSAPDGNRIWPVGSFGVDESVYGAIDLAGNVFDWCSDLFQQGQIWRSLRGGAWHGGDIWCRSAARIGLTPTEPYNAAGIRPVCVPPA